jgi:hypothetical protein
MILFKFDFQESKKNIRLDFRWVEFWCVKSTITNNIDELYNK